LLLQTSGTTGQPKVVPLSHANLLASARNIARALRLGPHDRGLAAMPLFHIHGLVGSLLTPLVAGGSVIVSDGADPDRLVLMLEDLEPTWINAVPALLHGMLAASERRGPARHALRVLRSSTASMSPADLDRTEVHFGVPIVEVYGMTEAASQVCSNSLLGLGPDRKPGSVGRPAGPEVVLLDPDLMPVQDGEAGEVCIRGANVTAGYEGGEHDGWITNRLGQRWFRTGDEGYFDPEGRLTLTGRLREMISRGGERVIPRRVDEALLEHHAVDQALAFAVPHPTLGEDLAAAVVLRRGLIVTESELRRHAFERLAPHEVPSRIVIVDELPCDEIGKPQRVSIAESLTDLLQSEGDLAIGELEHLIAAKFAELLEQDVPGRDANFFLLGGDSLSGTRVVSRLAQELSIDLNPSILFEFPTPRSLAARLNELL
jgi:acyl-CoA synthetase (AMP-forming)/AMP-acid ligase II/acyl carrier protein